MKPINIHAITVIKRSSFAPKLSRDCRHLGKYEKYLFDSLRKCGANLSNRDTSCRSNMPGFFLWKILIAVDGITAYPRQCTRRYKPMLQPRTPIQTNCRQYKEYKDLAHHSTRPLGESQGIHRQHGFDDGYSRAW